MRILCVAEKPSAAKKISELLSQNNFRTLNTGDTYVKNYCFNYRLNDRDTSICMTSLRGHVLTIEFADPQTKAWAMYPMINLFDDALERKPNQGGEAIVTNLKNQARSSDILFIWTDCDREGEAIGGEVVDICRSVKPDMPVWRARFSSMMPDQIHQAAQNHVQLDDRQVDAVNARQELDLRVGAAFTRLQTLGLRNALRRGDNDRKIISYGSCQFPTLGFVVSRYLLIERFIPEAFWKIQMSYVQPQTEEQIMEEEQEIKTNFTWRRNHLFNRWACLIFLEKCIEAKVAIVKKVKAKQTQKWKPLPLTTVEMQKVGCRVLNMSGEEIMTIAEKLYTSGLISYPRTETDQFDRSFEFMPIIDKLRPDPHYGQFAQLLHDGEFERPRNGKNNDKAHPPIHPTSYHANLSGSKRRVYDFIARRFLGACWKNAKGFETAVEVDMGGELFDAKGLVVLERNYLEVYTYDRWNGNHIPEFQEGDEFIPTELNMIEGTTTAPNLLTEPDLISLMEKNEIGTDATIAEHIQKIIEREYVFKRGRYFRPSTLGIALVLGYDNIGLESSLSQPFLRRQMEADLKRICEGTKTRGDVLQESISQYRHMFSKSEAEFNKMIASMTQYYREEEDRTGGAGAQRGIGQADDEDDNNNNNNNSGSNDNSHPSGRGGRGGRGSRGQGRGGNSSRGNSSRGSSSRGSSSRGSSSRRNSSRGRGRRGGGSSGSHTSPPPPPPRDGPNCGHGIPAVIRVSGRANSKGRQFYTCGSASGDTGDNCDFFEWVDAGPSGNNNNNNFNNNRNNNSNNSSFNNNRNNNNNNNNNRNRGNNSTPSCECGQPAVERTVTKNNENHGRMFYSCAKQQQDRCRFFEWKD